MYISVKLSKLLFLVAQEENTIVALTARENDLSKREIEKDKPLRRSCAPSPARTTATRPGWAGAILEKR